MDSFSNPNLDAFLRNHEINHIYVTGLDAVYCVDRTSQAALKRGYHVTVIRDAVISETESKRKEMFQKNLERGKTKYHAGDTDFSQKKESETSSKAGG